MFQGDLEKLWEKVSATMMEGVVVVDPKGIIQTVNHAMEEISGYTHTELIGQSCAIDQVQRLLQCGPSPSSQAVRAVPERCHCAL